ncbi:hypothetical protein SAY87_022881 [Trapa incisa]|uniref:TOG domain-containing protein n=1 Tax=Trapa incisa TaxID=236973 RepID=A0AAN7K3D4_9MYRT|nr:hypothetical protein SAY87_022881 [Trapa incisa]
MSLGEIESRVESLVQSETIAQLKSAVWKERLEAIGMLKQQVENIQALDQSVEILIRLLCALPGWNEKNVQVQQQVLEVITYIASTSSKFPKKCVVLCILGTSERVADIKTRAHAMKCLTTFSEAVGPGFVFERLYKIVKEHKNPKVLSEGILWMVSAVEDFGISHLKMKVRMESIEAVNKIIEEANKRIQPNGTAELLGALRGRLYDSNKNLIMTTLSTIGSVASAMGPPIEKASKGILSDVLKCLGDNKKQMRECTLATLELWLSAVHLDKMVPYIAGALIDSKLGAEGRKDLFEWLGKQLSGMSDFPDAVQLLKPVATSMMDKSADVRKAADACLAEILRVSGQDTVTKNLKDIQGPALAIVLERLKPHGALQESFEHTKTASLGPSNNSIRMGRPASHGLVKPGNRAISSRVNASKGTKSDLMMSVQDIAVQSQALLNVKDSVKEDRERMFVRRFKFEELRIEQIQDLENDMMRYFRDDLHRRLLSPDFRKQVDGLEMLQRALPSIMKEVIEVLDILLKWFVLRFCESNTTCLLKVLEFLPELFRRLKDEGYSLSESEAAIFLPCLMEKSGHNIEKVREKMRELMKQIVHTYSAAKTFPYMLEGLRSKNNRTRIECVDLVGFLIDHHGSEISGQLKSLQTVASLTAERDGEIRKAALNTMATGYKLLGDDIWRYVGKLTDAQRSMLDDRFKWKAREMDKRKEGKPGEARAALRRSVRDNGSDVAEQSGEVSRSISGSVFARETYGHSEIHTDRHIMVRGSAPSDWNEALDVISFGSPEQSVEGMKVVCHELAQAINYPDGSAMDDLVKDADRLVSCLADKVAKTFDFSLTGASSRSCKYVLNTLMQTFQIKHLAHAVKEGTLDRLITELLLWLLDERVPRMDDGSQLLKALNVLMLKILDNADRTSSFVVLINLLRPLDPLRWPSPAVNESYAVRNQKFSDLVVKCLIKLTKVLQSTIYEVDLDRILQSIHIYLQELGMEEIRRRAGIDDKPLRMVKTVLHELVKLRGTAIKGHLSLVPIDMEPQPIILAYIDLNLQTLAAAKMLTPTVPVGQPHWGDSAGNNPSAATHSTDAQLKQELAAIFKKIGDKQTCTIGLYELYRITQLYPKVDIFSQLQNASEAFRNYIRDGLTQMEKNTAAGRTPLSLSMATPPPAALNFSSPKIAPLSPVQTNPSADTKLINSKPDPTSFSLPPSYAETDRAVNPTLRAPASDISFADQLNERFPGGVTSGALDAIRERMKSIQLAAAASGNSDLENRAAMYMNGAATHGLMQNSSDHNSVENVPQAGVLPMDEKALSGLQARMERLKSGTMEPF